MSKKIATAGIICFLMACSSAQKTTDHGKGQIPIDSGDIPAYAKISEVFKCVCKQDSHITEQDDFFGYLKIEGTYCGSPFDGYKTVHLFGPTKEGKKVLIRLDYDCGPACSQKVSFSEIGESCQLSEVKAEKYLSKKKRFLSFPKGDRSLYLIQVPGDLIDWNGNDAVLLKMTAVEKWKWDQEGFVEDKTFRRKKVPMTRGYLRKYFQY